MFIVSSDALRGLVTKSTQGPGIGPAKRHDGAATPEISRRGLHENLSALRSRRAALAPACPGPTHRPFLVARGAAGCAMIPTAEYLGRRKVMPSSVSRRFCR